MYEHEENSEKIGFPGDHGLSRRIRFLYSQLGGLPGSRLLHPRRDFSLPPASLVINRLDKGVLMLVLLLNHHRVRQCKTGDVSRYKRLYV